MASRLPLAFTILESAESSLRDLMQSATSAGDYRDLSALMQIAEGISQLAADLPKPKETPSALADGLRPPTPTPVPANRARRGAKNEYPKFKREAERLVKIGWSKKDRSEYQHRAPKVVAFVLFNAIASKDPKSYPIAVESLLPLRDPKDGGEIAQHQVYVSLAWLKAEGIVQQNGRNGYSLLVDGSAQQLIEERWAALPKA